MKSGMIKMNLFEYKDLINRNSIHIATVNLDNNPNVAVASDVRVIEKNKIIISVNEMTHTPKNIESNPNVVLTAFNDKWVGLRMFDKGQFYTSGEDYEYCHKTFFLIVK